MEREQDYRNAEGQLEMDLGDRQEEPTLFWKVLPIVVIAVVIGMLWAPVVLR